MEQEVPTVGLDLAKNVFQVHAIAGDGAVLIRRKPRRSEVVFRRALTMSGWHGGVRFCPSFGA